VKLEVRSPISTMLARIVDAKVGTNASGAKVN
jgi:hypothetical protein